MCDLCSEETRKSALEGHTMRSEQLERFASYERAIASGQIKPHSPAMTSIKPEAVALIRFMVEDYL